MSVAVPTDHRKRASAPKRLAHGRGSSLQSTARRARIHAQEPVPIEVRHERDHGAALRVRILERRRDIATELEISPKTVDVHRANIKLKLNARTLAQVANTVNLARLAEEARDTS